MPEYIDSSSPYASLTALRSVTTTLINYDVKNGKKGFLLSFRNAIAAGGEAVCYFSLLLNGIPLEDFDRIQVMIAAPEDQRGQLVIRRQLPQGSNLKVIVYNSDPANDYNATAKLEIGYETI
jgi:hypothetical protein